MPRQKPNNSLHTRVVQGDRLRNKHSRAARKQELLRRNDTRTHWVGCESSHRDCAELNDIRTLDAWQELTLDSKVLEVVKNAEEPLTGRRIHEILCETDKDVLPGDVAMCIWNLAGRKKVSIGTDLKIGYVSLEGQEFTLLAIDEMQGFDEAILSELSAEAQKLKL